jgi:anti-sigma regulatory factor (Ser/Thr protein kinase)
MPYYRCTACGLTSYSAAAYSTAPSCPACAAILAEAAKLHLVPGEDRDLTRTLAARPESVAEARRTLVGLPLPDDSRQELALLVSELVTNSIRHAGLAAGDPVDMHVSISEGRVRLAVHDCGPGFERPRPARNPLAVGGQGFALVDALTDAWGVDADAAGCTVWCELPVRGMVRGAGVGAAAQAALGGEALL